jgi:hypothetical protein
MCCTSGFESREDVRICNQLRNWNEVTVSPQEKGEGPDQRRLFRRALSSSERRPRL